MLDNLFKTGLLALCGQVLLSTPAAAAALEEIQVTAIRGTKVARESVSAVSVVDRESLARSQPTIITDALKGAPGVFVQQTTPGQGTAIIRGLKGSEILHLVDGMRLNNALFRNAPNQYLALVDPWIVERTEIVRGPLSSIYGSDAMGGVVHLVTARPEFNGEQFAAKSRVRLGYDSSTLGRTVNSAIAAGRDDLAVGASFSYQSQDDVRAAERRVQAPSAFRARAASAFATLTDTQDRVWDLSVQFLEQPATPRYDELVAGFGQTQPASEQFLFTPNSRLFVHGTHKSSGYGHWLDNLEVHLGWQQMKDGRRTQDFGSPTVREEANRSDLLGLTIQGSAVEMEVHALTYGVDMYYDEVSSSRTETDLGIGTSAVINARFPDGSTLTNLDAYVHDRISISKNVFLDAGLRLSHARVDLTPTTSSAGAKISNLDVSGSVGLRYSLTDAMDLVGNLARGFRAPNIFDLGTLGARPGNRFNIANPDLGPEAVITGDFGIRFNLATASFEAVMWGSDYQDKIVSVFTGVVDANGRDIVQSQNASAVTLKGAELSGKWRPGERHTFDFTVNYTHGETRIEGQPAEPADRVPPLNGRLAWRFEQNNWSLGAQWSFADRQERLSARDVRDPRINPTGTPGWGAVDFLLGYETARQWRISARANNLFDRGYRYHGSGIDAPGRHIKLAVEGKF